MKPFFNIAKQVLNYISYVVGFILLILLTLLLVFHTQTVYHLLAYVLMIVGSAGTLAIDFKGFISKGVNWRDVYPVEKHKFISGCRDVLGFIDIIGLVLYLFIEKETLFGVTVVFSWFWFIIAAMVSVIFVLTLVNMTLMIVNYGLGKYNNHLDKVIELLDKEDEAGGNE